MNRLKNIAALLGMLPLLLAGCGTAESPANSGTGAGLNSPMKDAQPGTDNSQNKDDTNNQEKNGGIVRIFEKNLQFQINGETNEETAFLKQSENQNYSMYVLPEYELTAKEPDLDILFLSQNHQIAMTIELLPADEDWQTVTEKATSQLAAVNKNVQSVEPIRDEFYKNATVLEAAKAGETVTTYLIPNRDLPLKFTIFTREGADHRDAFLQMGKTILQKNVQ